MKRALGRRFIWARNSLVLVALVSGVLGPAGRAQSSSTESAAQPSASGPVAATNSSQSGQVPNAPGQAAASPRADGRIYGTVTDPDGNVVAGARVTLEVEPSKAQQTLFTDTTGSFTFSDLGAGTFRVAIAAKGFADWVGPDIVLSPGRYYQLPESVLRLAPANTKVEVVVTRYEEAEEQIKAQEQQRVLGVFPNFYTSYIWHAAPMTSGQKFRLALRSSIDPVTFATDAATAGIEQSQDYLSGYGTGGEGYAKRFGAVYADDVIGTFIGGAVFPSILHQDPRYFYKGTGSIAFRALYAISTVVICRGDNGRWQPNYSNVLGSLAAAGVSNLYYPASNRKGAAVTIDNALINTAEGAVGGLLQEFVFKKISRGVQQAPSAQP